MLVIQENLIEFDKPSNRPFYVLFYCTMLFTAMTEHGDNLYRMSTNQIITFLGWTARNKERKKERK